MLTPARTPIDKLARSIRQTSIVKFFEFAERHFGDQHLKQLSVSQAGPNREITINGHSLVNFGFDSFLGLDHHPRVKAAVARGAQEWGTQFGASRAFAVCGAEVELEAKIAAWMGTEAAVIFPSVTLTNMGVLAGITAPQDVIVFDEYAHNSIQEGAKIAKANGVRVFSFSHNNPASLEQVLESAKPYRSAVIAIDGVYSMSGAIAPLVELNEIALRHDGVLFIDDAHATGVLGDRGRGVVFEALGTYDNTIVVGCMSKACSVFGAFVACSHQTSPISSADCAVWTWRFLAAIRRSSPFWSATRGTRSVPASFCSIVDTMCSRSRCRPCRIMPPCCEFRSTATISRLPSRLCSKRWPI